MKEVAHSHVARTLSSGDLGECRYAKARGQLASIESVICIGDLPSRRAGQPQRAAATMPVHQMGVKRGRVLEDDAERQVKTARRDVERRFDEVQESAEDLFRRATPQAKGSTN